MKQQTVSPIEAPVTQKFHYMPPQANFVPLKLEERLETGVFAIFKRCTSW